MQKLSLETNRQYPNAKTQRKKQHKLSIGKVCLILVVVALYLQAIGLVKAGVPITLTDQHDIVAAGETAWFEFNLEEVEASDKTIDMWVEDLPADWTYDFSPSITDIAALETTTTTLNIHVPATASPGIYEFTVWVKANDLLIPILEQLTSYTGPLQIHAVPEVPLGTATGLASMIGAIALYIVVPKAKNKKP